MFEHPLNVTHVIVETQVRRFPRGSETMVQYIWGGGGERVRKMASNNVLYRGSGGSSPRKDLEFNSSPTNSDGHEIAVTWLIFLSQHL